MAKRSRKVTKQRGYSSQELKQIRILKNAINRTNKLLSEFGNKAEVTQFARLQLSAIGIDDTRKSITNKELSKLNVKGYQIKALEKIKTVSQSYKYYSKQSGVPYNPFSSENDLQSILEFAEQDYDMHEFINDNLELIYDYERENGTIISQKGNKPTWEDLLLMKQEIISKNKKEDLNINANHLPND